MTFKMCIKSEKKTKYILGLLIKHVLFHVRSKLLAEVKLVFQSIIRIYLVYISLFAVQAKMNSI